MNCFKQAQAEYEQKLFAPFDYLPLTEEEIDEIKNIKCDIGEEMLEEQLLKERADK